MLRITLLYVTSKSKEEAKKISNAVIEESLAACSNIIGEINSIFNWENRICNETEIAFLLKTSPDKTHALTERIIELHSYEVPCIIEIPVNIGNKKFFQWVIDQTKI